MVKSLNFRQILGLLILIAILVTAGVIIRYFVHNSKKDTKNVAQSASADITMKSIHFTESEQNRKKWELFAGSGIYDKPAEKTSLEDIRFIVERTNKSPVTVTAKNGEYLHTAKTVHLRGNVLAKTEENGLTFETSQIQYDSATKSFTTKEKIRLTEEALSVEGAGMDLFVERQQAFVKSQVEAVVYPAKRTK